MTLQKKQIKKELDKAKALEIVSQSEGGEIIKGACMKDIIDILTTLSNNFDKLSHTEMIAKCATLKEKLLIIEIFKNAKINKKILLEELKLLEAEEQEEQ
jgi:hypothetical protein